MKRNFILPVALVSSLIIGSAAVALGGPHYGPGPRANPFAQLDTNKDGKVTRQEAQVAKVTRFKALDTNRDGVVTEQEAVQARQKRGAERFAKMDANKDGRLSKTEVKMPDQRFQKLDVNKDGTLTQNELLQGKRKGNDSKRKGMWMRLDSNKDGKITEKEATAAADRMFEKLDANKDGAITQEEMRKARRHGPKVRSRDGRRGHGQRSPKAS